MKHNFKYFACLLVAVLCFGQVWATDYELVYTLDGSVTSSASGSSAYATAVDINVNDITWNVMGNTTLNPWGIGGKNLSNTDRVLFSKGAVPGNILKIDIEHGAASNVTVNSMKVEVAKDADFKSIVSTCNPTFAANSTVIVNHPDGDAAWEDCYYRITYNLTIGNSNKKVEFKSAKFYKEASGEEPGGDEPGGDDPDPQTGDNYELVTNASNLASGDKIIIVNADGTKALSTTQNNNNRGVADVTVSNDVITPGEEVQILTLGVTNSHWTLYTGAGYLYASSSSSNQLKTQTTNNTNGEWTITIDNSAVATITAQGSNTRNVMQYNSTSSIFACYSSASQSALSIFKKSDGSTPKQAAGLAFDAADAQKLVKVDGSLTAPTLTNPNSLTPSYASSDASVVAVNASTGELTIKAAGKAVITASSAEDDTYKAGSASYTIFVAEQAGTAEDPLTEANAKTLIDNGCTLSVHVKGTVATVGTLNTTYGSITLTLSGTMQFYGMLNIGGEQFTTNPFVVGDIVTAVGNLKKFNSTYELDTNCQLVEREAYTEPKVDISNTEESAYTPAKAIELYDDVTSDLTKVVYVKGIVTSASFVKNQTGTSEAYNGTYNVYVKAENDNNENPTTFEFFRMFADDDNNIFEEGAIQVGELIVAKGLLSKHNSTYEFAQGCHMVSKKSKATMTFDDLELVTGDVETLAPKTITLAQASAVSYSIKEGSEECVSLSGAQITATAAGEATIVATIATTDDYFGTSVEFAVTVTAAPVVLTDYYEKVTETAGITDGTYLIVYEADGLAFNGGLTTLDAESNTIAVAITNDNKIGVTEATAAATFFIDVTAGSILAANGKYIGVSSYGNGLKTSETSDYTNAFAIDGDGNAVISINNATWNKGSEGTMILRYNSASGQTRFRYYKEGGQQAIQLYKLANETVKEDPQLTWSAESVTITVGDEFISPTLSHKEGFTGTITFASDNESLATVSNAGVISLEAEATGIAHITASFAGDDTYKAVNVACTITVNAAAPVPAGTDNVVIIAEYDSKFYAMTNSLANGALVGVEVEKDGSTIVVSTADDKAAIQWTAEVSGNNTTLKDANNKYIKGSSGASLSLDDAAYNWNWDSEKSCYISSSYNTRGLFFSSTGNVFKGYALSNLESNGYAAIEVIEIDPENIVVTSKVDPQLAYNPASDEITIGGAWSAPSLGYANGFDGLDAVTYVSNNESVAAVTNTGVISLAGGIGTAVITASFAGNTNYLSGSATYTIVVNDIPDNCDGTDDFENEISGNTASSYDSRVTTNQWVAINAQWTTINNEQCYFTLNGKTTAVGKIQSPTLSGGIASLKVHYANTNSEANGVSFKVEIKQGEDVVREYTITKTNAEVSKGTVYTETFTSINVEGDFLILITNLSPSSNSTSNKDRLSIGKLCWTNYSAPVVPEPEFEEVRTGLEPGRFYTICMPKNILAIRGASFWGISKRDQRGSVAYLEEESAPYAAGKPFLFYATSDKLEVAYGTETDKAGTNGALHGTLSYMTADDLDNALTAAGSDIYMMYQNAFHPLGTNNHLDANRAYLVYGDLQAVSTDPQSTPGRQVRKMPLQGNVATGIEEGTNADNTIARKVMIDGQLFILRGEKMYDATGAFVK